ncbi:vesicle-associated membrane protein 8 isoform X2 [Colossoma macropomum]|uniref:vesicle-associated membrane protein 8 isoform X2 n=1 Tax=Colossoma macropomum TaxID=42526 RepID=UPI001863D8B3|nr:vesicle-associated membrane protein 8 isoform X2 [Colossoma macropomum]
MGVGDPNKMGAAAGPVEEVDRVKTLQSQVDGVKDIMTQNVDRILARGERLDDLMDKSEDLQAGAQNFKQTSQKVARAYWWKNVKLILVIVVVVVIIVLIIVLLATGVIPTSGSAPAPPTPPTQKPPK